MPSDSDVKRVIGSAIGYVFLLLALVAALCGVFVLALVVADAAIPGLIVGLPLFFGVATFCLFVGVIVHKAVAGTVLPLAVDTDGRWTKLFRGGQG